MTNEESCTNGTTNEESCMNGTTNEENRMKVTTNAACTENISRTPKNVTKSALQPKSCLQVQFDWSGRMLVQVM